MEAVKLVHEENVCYDKKEIALAIRNSTLDDEMECSLLLEGVLQGCDGCGLRSICEGLDNLCCEYIKETTKVVETFTF